MTTCVFFQIDFDPYQPSNFYCVQMRCEFVVVGEKLLVCCKFLQFVARLLGSLRICGRILISNSLRTAFSGVNEGYCGEKTFDYLVSILSKFLCWEMCCVQLCIIAYVSTPLFFTFTNSLCSRSVRVKNYWSVSKSFLAVEEDYKNVLFFLLSIGRNEWISWDEWVLCRVFVSE